MRKAHSNLKVSMKISSASILYVMSLNRGQLLILTSIPEKALYSYERGIL
jgi:hypothetical protein